MKTLIILFVSFLFSYISYCQTAEEYFGRGLSKHELQDYRGAISDYSKAIELNPNDAAAYYNRGVAKHDLHDYS